MQKNTELLDTYILENGSSKCSQPCRKMHRASNHHSPTMVVPNVMVSNAEMQEHESITHPLEMVVPNVVVSNAEKYKNFNQSLTYYKVVVTKMLWSVTQTNARCVNPSLTR